MDAEKLSQELYDKMAVEQEQFKRGLLEQTPEEILDHAYEYTMREDILMEMEAMELSVPQREALLSSSSPLEDIYRNFRNAETNRMDVLSDCIKTHAKNLLKLQWKAARSTPVYTHSETYAAEHGELELFSHSLHLNERCAKAIDEALAEHYSASRLDAASAAKDVVEQFGYERVFYVLANTVRNLERDRRIAYEHIEWAGTIPGLEGKGVHSGYVLSEHPGLISMLIKQVRHDHLLTLPLSREDIKAEAQRILHQFQTAREPNSPGGAHFMARVSPDFLARAKTKDQNRLVDMLPFPSLSLTSMEGRTGVFALISKDENRDQKLRLRKQSIKAQLVEKPTPGDQPAVKPKDLEVR